MNRVEGWLGRNRERGWLSATVQNKGLNKLDMSCVTYQYFYTRRFYKYISRVERSLLNTFNTFTVDI